MNNIGRAVATAVCALVCLMLMSAVAATAPDSIRIQVSDSQTGMPVEFCNILAKNVETGALADEWGRATLRVGPRTLRDTLLVSSVGYEKRMVAMTPDVPDTLRITLRRKEYPLPEVIVRPPSKAKTIKKGKRHAGGMARTFMKEPRGTCLAWEAGKKGRRTWLTAVEIHSWQSSFYN